MDFVLIVPFVSLAAVLVALGMIGARTGRSRPWVVVCYVAAVLPALTVLAFLLTPGAASAGSRDILGALSMFLIMGSLMVSAPLAAVMSMAIALHLRESA